MGPLILPGLLILAAAALAGVFTSLWWLFAAVPLLLLLVLGVRDYVQPRYFILRDFPVLGHVRFLLERIRPELQQYFSERNDDGRPYDRDTRSVVYQRAKGMHGEQAFGAERDVEQSGYELEVHSAAPREPEPARPRVRIGGPDCTQPYDMALLNVSAMSFGAHARWPFRPGQVPGQGRGLASKVRLAEAESGCEAGHRRRAAGSEGDP
jgi:hypothetical protein